MRKGSGARQQQHLLLKKEFSRAEAYTLEYWGENPQAHFFNTRIRRVSELLADFHQGRVLDIGCGPAVVGNIFRGKPIDYHGVDLSEAMIEVCLESYKDDPRYGFSVQEIEKLGFAHASFDVILCLGILEYVLDQPAAVQETVRVLRPGGTLIATMLNKTSPSELWERYVHGRVSSCIRKVGGLLKKRKKGRERRVMQKSERPVARLLAEKAFRRLLASGGLEIEDTLSYDFKLVPPPWDSLMPRESLWLSRNLEFLCRSRLRFLGRGLILKCRKTLPALPAFPEVPGSRGPESRKNGWTG